MTEKARTGRRAAAGLLLVLAAGACSNATDAKPGNARQDTAWAVCRDAVQKQIKSSSEVQFSEQRVKAMTFGFEFTGVVEAQVGGSTAKNDYTCSAEENGSDWIAAGVSVV